MLTLVIYDITNNKQRTKLAKHLHEYGLQRVQKSGFVGELNPNDRMIVVKELRQFITEVKLKVEDKEKELGHALLEDELTKILPDSVYVLPLCDRCMRLCRIVSDSELALEHTGQVTIVE